jgi:hypothetical protein
MNKLDPRYLYDPSYLKRAFVSGNKHWQGECVGGKVSFLAVWSLYVILPMRDTDVLC